jgi:hypothetical protein
LTPKDWNVVNKGKVFEHVKSFERI